MHRRFGRTDGIFLTGLAFFCILLCVLIYGGGRKEGSFLTITIDGREYGTYLLTEDREIHIPVEGGYNFLVIEQGSAYMKDASCPDHLCCRQNPIAYDRQSIICLPNRVVITVTSKEQTDVDLMVGR